VTKDPSQPKADELSPEEAKMLISAIEEVEREEADSQLQQSSDD
jgi:hypothetical protein